MMITPSVLLLLSIFSAAVLPFFKNTSVSKWVAFVLSSLILVGALILCHFSYYGILPMLDSLSIIMVMITAISIPLVILSTFQFPPDSSRYFYSLIFLLEAALLSVFTTRHALIFYVSWEASIIPALLMLFGWQKPRLNTVILKFFLYTFAGGMCLLFSLLVLYYYPAGAHSFDIFELIATPLPHHLQIILFLPLFLAFAIKLPIFPFHTWQPETYSSASTPTGMLLVALLSKLGLYGILRILLPVLPFGSEVWHKGVLVLAIGGLLYSASIALIQTNFRKVLAYSSVSHCCLMVIGVFSQSFQGIQGGIVLMIAHTVNTLGLFYMAGIIERRTGTLELDKLGGIKQRFPLLATAFFVLLLGSIAFPLTNGFVGEFLILWGVFSTHPILGMITGIGFILGAWYMLNLFQRTMLGATTTSEEHTLSLIPLPFSSLLVIVTLCGSVVLFGIYPKPLLAISAPIAKALSAGVSK